MEVKMYGFYGGILAILIISSVILRHTRRRTPPSEPVFVQSFGLGTVIQITASGPNAQAALEEAVLRVGQIDDQTSYFKKESEISRINQNAGLTFQSVSPDTYTVIKKAVHYSQLSYGALDLTIRPLVNLWGIGHKNARLPDASEINAALTLVNYRDIELYENCHSIRLSHPKQCLDLGCIAKGFAADEVKKVLEKHRVKSALINLGGNIYALGRKPNQTPWKIGIQHPFQPRGNYLGFLSLKDQSAVTSGDYEKFFTLGNHHYHHIIDPQTGYPVDNGIISTTIISHYSIDGDALTTCLFVMGIAKGLKFIETFKDVAALIITKELKIYGTKQLKKQLTITDNQFSWG
jgi:thiamine biosynthesis lipoprotein